MTDDELMAVTCGKEDIPADLCEAFDAYMLGRQYTRVRGQTRYNRLDVSKFFAKIGRVPSCAVMRGHAPSPRRLIFLPGHLLSRIRSRISTC